jgi:hypothetical protein
VWSASRPGRFTPGKDPIPIVQEAGWAPAKNLAPTRIWSPDHPAYSQSLYQLIYPAHKKRKKKRGFIWFRIRVLLRSILNTVMNVWFLQEMGNFSTSSAMIPVSRTPVRVCVMPDLSKSVTLVDCIQPKCSLTAAINNEQYYCMACSLLCWCTLVNCIMIFYSFVSNAF